MTPKGKVPQREIGRHILEVTVPAMDQQEGRTGLPKGKTAFITTQRCLKDWLGFKE